MQRTTEDPIAPTDAREETTTATDVLRTETVATVVVASVRRERRALDNVNA